MNRLRGSNVVPFWAIGNRLQSLSRKQVATKKELRFEPLVKLSGKDRAARLPEHALAAPRWRAAAARGAHGGPEEDEGRPASWIDIDTDVHVDGIDDISIHIYIYRYRYR